jgi:NTP pyrophosphatase (non-canonical NTP hydrolase)
VRQAANLLQDACHGASRQAGWWGDHIPELRGRTRLGLALSAEKLSEVSEAMEGLRKDAQDTHLQHRKMFEVELADAAIRIFDLAGAMGFDLGGAIAEKLTYNATRADHTAAARKAAGGKAF